MRFTQAVAIHRVNVREGVLWCDDVQHAGPREARGGRRPRRPGGGEELARRRVMMGSGRE